MLDEHRETAVQVTKPVPPMLYADKAIGGLCPLMSAEVNAKGFPRQRASLPAMRH